MAALFPRRNNCEEQRETESNGPRGEALDRFAAHQAEERDDAPNREEKGRKGRGDLIVRAHWNGRNESAAIALDRRAGCAIERCRGRGPDCEMERRITSKRSAADEPPSLQMLEKLRRTTDAELFAAGLRERVS